MLAILLLAQIAQAVPSIDSTYSTPALREVVARVAAANHSVPDSLRGYTSRIETETSLLLRDTLGREETASIEQFATNARWDRGGKYDLHIVGYRSQSVGVPYSTLTIVRAWTVPTLYGDRLSLGAYFSNQRRADTLRSVHPFAADRDEFYHFSGGDTVTVLNVGTRRIPIVRIRTIPHFQGVSTLAAFDGEVDVDAQRWQIVRMRGRFVVAGLPAGKRGIVNRALGIVGVAYGEFVNAEIDGKYWLPAFQRTEFQASFAFLGQTRPIFRIVSKISDVRTDEITAIANDSVLAPTQIHLDWAPSDSISAFSDWQNGLGVETSAVHSDDFQDMAPDIWRTDGPPRLNLFPATTSRMLRFNRIEGFYTGIAPSIDFRSAVPGLSVGAWGGWAWTEQTARGGAIASYRVGPTTYAARADRTLAWTNDFSLPLEDDVGFAALVSPIDDYDYVDRRRALVSATHTIGGVNEAIATLQLGVAHDGTERARLNHGFISPGVSFRPNRNVAPGSYGVLIGDIELHPNVTGDYVSPGIGVRGHVEAGSGDLDWTRAELGLSARKYLGPVALAAHMDGGAVLGNHPPPQTLFELGGNEALPGYSYKEFVGDRAVLFRGFASYRFPVWQRPVHVWRNLLIPGVGPGVALSAQGGWTKLTSAGALSSAAALVAGTGEIARPTGNIRSTVGAGITLFSDLLHVGVARPTDHAAKWRFVAGFGATF